MWSIYNVFYLHVFPIRLHSTPKWQDGNECSWAHNFCFSSEVNASTKAHPWGLTPPTPGGGSRLPSPIPVWAQRLPGAVLSNTRFTFYLLLNIFTFLWVAICTEKPVILVLYNSTFLVDCCVEFCEKYLRKGLYCINKLFVSCERWVETDISSPFPLQLTYSPFLFSNTQLSTESKDVEWNNSVWQKKLKWHL